MIVDGYIRVSQVRRRSGPRFISPLDQRDRIESWARLHDVQVGEVFEELDESGARADRPLFLRAIERVEAGHTNGVVVAHLDRFGRSLADGLVAIERIRAAGGTFVSVSDGFDIRTPAGKLVLRIMLSMAEFDLDRIRENFDAARARAVERGMHMGTWTPLGYRKLADGHLVPDPAVAPHVAEVFRLRADGAPWAELGAYVRTEGVRTVTGRQFWDPSSIYVVIRNRVYRGEVHSGDYVNGAAHEPIVDELTWQLAQRPAVRASAEARGASVLTGLVRCASCRYAMSRRCAAAMERRTVCTSARSCTRRARARRRRA